MHRYRSVTARVLGLRMTMADQACFRMTMDAQVYLRISGNVEVRLPMKGRFRTTKYE